MKHPLRLPLLALSLFAALSAPAFAQDHSAHAGHGSPAASTAPAAASNEAVMTAGEITRVDTRSGKLTIRHEEIKNLAMPAMTMVFGLKDPAQAVQFKPGDKVRFHAEDMNGALVVTKIEAAQ